MGIQANFDMSAIRAYAYSKHDELMEALMEAMKTACIKMVKRAKQTNTYKDQTHKLRSSIGCVLYHNGLEVFNYFEDTGGEMGIDGVNQGLAFARKKAGEEAGHAMVAVVVAGAEYARYVEHKGFDVLTGSSYEFEADIGNEIREVMGAFKKHVENGLR